MSAGSALNRCQNSGVVLDSTGRGLQFAILLGLGGFSREEIELAGRSVSAHLPIPIIFLELLEPPEQFLTLRRGQVNDGFLDFSQAHAPKLHDDPPSGKLKVQHYVRQPALATRGA